MIDFMNFFAEPFFVLGVVLLPLAITAYFSDSD